MRLLNAMMILTLGACAGSAQHGSALMPDPLDGVGAEELYAHGLALASRGDSVRAEQYMVAAIDAGADEAEVLPQLVRVCVSSGRLGSALHRAEPYLMAHPQEWRLRHLVAALLLGLGRSDDALLHLQQVVREVPGVSLPRFTLGQTYAQVGKLADAKVAFESYLELEPDGPHAVEARSWLASHLESAVVAPAPSEATPVDADSSANVLTGDVP